MTLYGYFRTDRKTLVFQGFVRCNRGVTWLFCFFVRLHLGYIVFGQAKRERLNVLSVLLISIALYIAAVSFPIVLIKT